MRPRPKERVILGCPEGIRFEKFYSRGHGQAAEIHCRTARAASISYGTFLTQYACIEHFGKADDGRCLAWDFSARIDEYFEWENGTEPDFLYDPLVDLVESKACEDIDFCHPSDEKWAFAEAFLSVLESCIRQIPDDIFQKNGFQREEVLFFATMGDGDYIQEMLEASLKMFNAKETLEAFGIVL